MLVEAIHRLAGGLEAFVEPERSDRVRG